MNLSILGKINKIKIKKEKKKNPFLNFFIFGILVNGIPFFTFKTTRISNNFVT